MAHCKRCHGMYAIVARENNAPMIVNAPKVEDSVIRECQSYNLEKVPPRLLVAELRRRGYRGELELITVQKVKI